MAKKEIADKNVQEIKKLLKSRELVIGTDRTVTNIRRGKVKKVYLASNCNEKVKADINHYSSIGAFDVIELQYPNDELGTMCKKPFSISVISILKGGK